MKKIYSTSDVMLVSRLKNALQERGVACVLKNADLHGGLTHGKPAKPELWVIDDGQIVRANRLLDNLLVSELSHSEPWLCVNCGQELENQFDECWNCGAQNDFVIPLEEENDADEAEEEE